MNSKDIQRVKKSYEIRYNFRCTDEIAIELLELSGNDIDIVLRAIERTKRHYKLKEFMQSKNSSQQDNDNSIDCLQRRYEPALDENIIDREEYNYLLQSSTPSDKTKSLQYRVQRWWYEHMWPDNPSLWIQGLGLSFWQVYAFRMFAVEQQVELDMQLINSESQRYKYEYEQGNQDDY